MKIISLLRGKKTNKRCAELKISALVSGSESSETERDQTLQLAINKICHTL